MAFNLPSAPFFPTLRRLFLPVALSGSSLDHPIHSSSTSTHSFPPTVRSFSSNGVSSAHSEISLASLFRKRRCSGSSYGRGRTVPWPGVEGGWTEGRPGDGSGSRTKHLGPGPPWYLSLPGTPFHLIVAHSLVISWISDTVIQHIIDSPQGGLRNTTSTSSPNPTTASISPLSSLCLCFRLAHASTNST
jgi:hypothetical protein